MRRKTIRSLSMDSGGTRPINNNTNFNFGVGVGISSNNRVGSQRNSVNGGGGGNLLLRRLSNFGNNNNSMNGNNSMGRMGQFKIELDNEDNLPGRI
ncbi:102_t:CDS:2 [Entrophospora sp. SA101]|nr:102_t:CDS:2 [Entrophospora sp. SA101]CAJ0841630.1 665_t:CDS:2 [Entrophospora sp. SA101]